MKKFYTAPEVEVEEYATDAALASNCAEVVNNGPAMPGYEGCTGFPEIEEPEFNSVSLYGTKPHNVSFYDDPNLCDCYYTAEDKGYWTS